MIEPVQCTQGIYTIKFISYNLYNVYTMCTQYNLYETICKVYTQCIHNLTYMIQSVQCTHSLYTI